MPTAQAQKTTSASTSAQPTKPLWSRLLPFILVFLAACVLLFGELGRFVLFNPDEALYAEPAREMLEIRDYITTYLNYVVRFTKPPLVIWAQALGILAFGVNEFAVRYFQSACGAILVAATYWFTEKFVNRRAAIAAGLMLATAPLFIGTSREAITDTPLALFMASALMAFFAGSAGAGKKWVLTGWVCVGLSVMTKGPVGLVLPAAILFGYHLLKGDLRSAWRCYRPISGLAIVGLIALPWFVTEIAITKGAYFNEFILRENVQRYTSVVDSHKGGWWYHLLAMLGGFAPWSLFLPAAIVAGLPLAEITRLFGWSQKIERQPEISVSERQSDDGWVSIAAPATSKPVMPEPAWVARPLLTASGTCTTGAVQAALKTARKSHRQGLMGGLQDLREAIQPTTLRQSIWLFTLVWAGVTLVFFSASVSKLLPYTLPAFPALAVLVAIEFERIFEKRQLKALLIPCVLFAVALAVIGAALPALSRKLPVELPQVIRSFISFELFATLATIILVARRFWRAAFILLVSATMVGYLYFGSKILTQLSESWERPLTDMAMFAGKSKDPIFVYDMRKPSVPFYARRQIVQPGNPTVLGEKVNEAGNCYVLAKKSTKPVLAQLGCKIIAEEGQFVMARHTRQ